MAKYYYENLLFNQNITAKPNIAWVCDITEVELDQNKKFYIFLCIDIHTNKIVACTTSRQVIEARNIVKCLTKAIKNRFRLIPKIKVILHSDRGTQFSSNRYNVFVKEFREYLEPSMSRENTPTDNAVAERFMQTFKSHQIDGKIIEQAIQEAIILEKHPKLVVNKYIKSLNNKPNKKSARKAPERHDKDVVVASMLMGEPLQTKAFSERFGSDIRRDEISKFKLENNKVRSLLEEIAAKKAEVVNSTPFDNKEGNVVIELIDKRLTELYELILNNQYIVRKTVEGAIEPVGEGINDNIDELRDQVKEEMLLINKKLDMLLPKPKKERKVELLRDPLDSKVLPIFLINAGNIYPKLKDLRRAQLRVCYVILYHTGLRINEIRGLTRKDLFTAIESTQFNLVHYKTKKAHIHVLSKGAVQQLKSLKNEYFIIFEKYNYQYLFGKSKPVADKTLIRMVNKDLKATCNKFNIPFNIKSHSFRVNMITNLLRVTSVQNTADIIGHSDIRSTMSYNRYSLTKKEIQDLLDKLNK